MITEAPEVEEETEEVTEAAEEETTVEEETTEEVTTVEEEEEETEDDVEAEIIRRLQANGGVEDASIKEMGLTGLGHPTNKKVETDFGFTPHMSERIIKNMILDELGYDTEEYDLDFVCAYVDWPDFLVKTDVEGFIRSYNAQGNLISAGGWMEFVVYEKSTSNYACFTGGGPNVENFEGRLMDGTHVWLAVQKNVGKYVEEKMVEDLVAGGTWNGKKNTAEECQMTLGAEFEGAADDVLAAEVLRIVNDSVNGWENTDAYLEPVRGVAGDPDEYPLPAVEIEEIEDGSFAYVAITWGQDNYAILINLGYELSFEG